MTILSVCHTTTYRYSRSVTLGPHRLMLRPRDGHDLRLISTELTCSPPAALAWSYDIFGNSVANATFAEAAATLTITSRITLEQYSPDWPVFEIAASALAYPFSYSEDDCTDLGAMRIPQYPDPKGQLKAWAEKFVRSKPTDTLALLKDLNAGISAWVFYQSRDEEGTQAPLETLDRGWGSCRDIAMLLIEAARALGFGARIVSGYRYDPDLGQIGLQGAGSTHAWAEIYLPGAGWISFDPTNRTLGGAHLIRVAVARDITQAVPISGSFHGVPDDFLGMSVAVSVSAAQGIAG